MLVLRLLLTEDLLLVEVIEAVLPLLPLILLLVPTAALPVTSETAAAAAVDLKEVCAVINVRARVIRCM